MNVALACRMNFILVHDAQASDTIMEPGKGDYGLPWARIENSLCLSGIVYYLKSKDLYIMLWEWPVHFGDKIK